MEAVIARYKGALAAIGGDVAGFQKALRAWCELIASDGPKDLKDQALTAFVSNSLADTRAMIQRIEDLEGKLQAGDFKSDYIVKSEIIDYSGGQCGFNRSINDFVSSLSPYNLLDVKIFGDENMIPCALILYKEKKDDRN